MTVPAWAERAVRLTRSEYFADFFITPPITLVLAVHAARHAAWLPYATAVVLGWMAWTFYEYAVHRWVSHRAWWMRDLHWLHHRNQRDYIALHPVITVATYALLWGTLGAGSSAFFVGFGAGYVIYAALHTAYHHARIDSDHWLGAARRRHALHHRDHHANYGVTVSWWDRLLGTHAAS